MTLVYISAIVEIKFYLAIIVKITGSLEKQPWTHVLQGQIFEFFWNSSWLVKFGKFSYFPNIAATEKDKIYES